MKANYGYMDGSGDYFITIDTDKCVECETRACVAACPANLFVIEEDDWDDLVALIAQDKRKSVKYDCAPCKPVTDRPPLPCMAECPFDAIEHSW
ncbi:4Fe-4S dicluster domain-containing protein [bacterium]|nr:4Fe-4S dicluster domain-containing protein [bacterium]